MDGLLKMDTKQVIVIRRDLNVRRGKEIAQACHSSMAFLLDKIEKASNGFWPNQPVTIFEILELSPAEIHWILGATKKICLQAKDLDELLEVEKLCKKAGLTVHVITDMGLTEFKEPTITALAIGPDESQKIDAITGLTGERPLKLY